MNGRAAPGTKTIAPLALMALVGCSSSGGGGSSASFSVRLEGTGRDAEWVFAVENRAKTTLMIHSLEWGRRTGDAVEYKSVGGMAEIAHSCRQGTTTIPAGETVEFFHAVEEGRGTLHLRLTYSLGGEVRTDVVKAAP